MSGPVAVDATVKAMVELVTRASKDVEFRRLCEADMAAAIADLETPPADGASFEYAWKDGGYALRIRRGDETTTVAMSADGQLTVDNDALGFSRPSDDELSDLELMAVAGGGFSDNNSEPLTTCGCGSMATTYLKNLCKSACICFNESANFTSWVAIEKCATGVSVCLAVRGDGGMSFMHNCNGAGSTGLDSVNP